MQTENGLYPYDAIPPDNSSLEISMDASINSVLKSNKYCADCHDKNPKWASVNLGVIVCLKCSGGHRKLGSKFYLLQKIYNAIYTHINITENQ